MELPGRYHLQSQGTKRKREGEQQQVAESVGQGCSASSLKQLWPRDGSANGTTIDIIAIHGLDTQSPSTWRAYRNQKDNTEGIVHWLDDEDMLHSRFPTARIFTYDWPSRTYRDAVDDDLAGHANTLLDKMQHRDCPHQRLIFIASCFGGLLLAKAMTLASVKTSEHPELPDLIVGMLFLGTPFGSSDAGTAAQIRIRLAKAMGGESCDKLVGYLRRNDERLDEMVHNFEQLIRLNNGIGVHCYYETLESNILNALLPAPFSNFTPWGKMILVPKYSAKLGGCTLTKLEVKHALLNKFYGPEDKNYITVCDGLNDLVKQAESCDIDVMLKKYYAENDGQRLRIERLSGEALSMERCYINLCIIEHDRDFDVKIAKEELRHTSANVSLSKFSLSARLEVETPPESRQVTLQTLFEPRMLSKGQISRPKHILIWGRAGVGKSTLCKKIVHDFIYNELWSEFFDRVFWIPLRELKLKGMATDELVKLILRKFFFRVRNKVYLESILWSITKIDGNQQRQRYGDRTLFILDGLDEVSQILDPAEPMRRILGELLNQNNTIVTSRPHFTDIIQGPPPDLELETTGFFPEQVEEYLKAEREQNRLSEETVSEIQSFIQTHPVVQSLTRIPIQLDAICFSWGGNLISDKVITMTKLYQEIEQKLWEKYLIRQDNLTEFQIQDSPDIMELVKSEIDFLGKLAFGELCKDNIEFDVKCIRTTTPAQRHDKLLNMPFIRSSDTSLSLVDRTYHFIHLTFQEYFAARYFTHHWVSDTQITIPGRIQAERRRTKADESISPQDFLRWEKYSPRYNIFWRFVAGLLQENGRHLEQFFSVLEDEPRDLLGPAHQRIVIHCLNEIDVDNNDVWHKARDLEDIYRQWILIEYYPTEATSLAQAPECPDRIFEALLQGSSDDKYVGLFVLTHRQIVSPTLLEMVMHEAQHSPSRTEREFAYCILGNLQHQTLKLQLVHFWEKLTELDSNSRQNLARGLGRCRRLHQPGFDMLIRLLNDENSIVCHYATQALRAQSQLPDTVIEALVRELDNEDKNMQYSAANVLGQRSDLPDAIVKVLEQRLEDDENNEVRYHEVVALKGQRQLSKISVEALLQQLDHENAYQRYCAVKAFKARSQLSDSVLEGLMQRLDNEDQEVRYYAAISLRGQRQLPAVVVTALLRRFDDENRDVRYQAAMTLSEQDQLPEVVIEGLVQRLDDEDKNIQCDAAKALREQTQLPVMVINDLAWRLKNMDQSVQGIIAEVLVRQGPLSLPVVKALLSTPFLAFVKLHMTQALSLCEELPDFAPFLNPLEIKELLFVLREPSFKISTTCYIIDNYLYINGKRGPIPLGEEQLEAIRLTRAEFEKQVRTTVDESNDDWECESESDSTRSSNEIDI